MNKRSNLNELMEMEVNKILLYSTTERCSEAKKGYEAQYNEHKKKIQTIQRTRDKLLFSEANLAPYFSYLKKKLKDKNNPVKGGKTLQSAHNQTDTNVFSTH